MEEAEPYSVVRLQLAKHKLFICLRMPVLMSTRFDNDGQSPLVIAAKKSHLNVIIIFLEAGADVNASNPKG